MPKVRQLTEIDASMGEVQIGVLVEIIAAALQRNYPNATADTVEDHLALANFHLAQGDVDRAEQEFQAAASKTPVGSVARLKLADFYVDIGSPVEKRHAGE